MTVIANIIVGCYLATLFLTIAYRKLIGLELATLIQMGYLSLLMNPEITVYLQPIANWKFVFGYNEYFLSPRPDGWYALPYYVYGYRPHFGFSNNLMIILGLCIYAIAAILYAISKVPSSKKTSEMVKGVSYMIANDLCYTLVVFLTPNILTAIYI